MADVMTPTEGEGADLRDLLAERLGVPKHAKWFEVRFALGEPVTVRCAYMASLRPEPSDDDEDPEPQAGNGGLDG